MARMDSGAWRALLAGIVAVALAGCANYVKRDDYDATIADLRSSDRALEQRVGALEARVDDLARRLEEQFAVIQELRGRLRVDMPVHFAFDDATVREEDKPRLDEFARVIREHHPGVLVTVEGFADPAGSAAYNERLAQRRADAVRDYLVASGLADGNVRAVSYGETRERQVDPGACCGDGIENRRVSLVVDYVPVEG